jgi:hypothetical protein
MALLVIANAEASDVYAFRFRTSGASTSCPFATDWHDDLIFHNTTAEGAAVRLLEMTGGDGDRTEQLEVPAGRTVSLADKPGMWEPFDGGLWVVHLDVPAGVLVSSRAGAFSRDTLGGVPPSGIPDLGAFPMPVFPALAAPGQSQLLMGADLGAENARVNVGVYNAGNSAATVTIEVHAGCDDGILETTTLSVSAGVVQQVGGLGHTSSQCPVSTVNTWLRYVTVRADQPTLSYVSNLQNDAACLARMPYSAVIP